MLPIFANAQRFNRPRIDSPNPLFPMQEKSPKLPQLETVKPLSLNRVEKTKAKLAREEQKLVKLARKTWDQEDNLKKEQKQLQDLENNPKNSNDPYHQKNIDKCKKQIAKSQNKLNEAKTELELRSKKVEDLEKAVEEAKFTRKEN